MVQQKYGGLLDVALRAALMTELCSAACCQPVQLLPNICLTMS